MTEQQLRENVAKNLVAYRKLNHMTQLELAEKLNYSDKSVSKWERGDGLPDLYVINRIAELFDITVNDLISPKRPKKYLSSRRKQHIIIPLLSIALVWLIATVVYMVVAMLPFFVPMKWLTFIYAIPVSSILLVVYTALWWSQISKLLSISLLTWSVALSVFVTVSIHGISLIWAVAAVLQLMEILWFILRYRKTKE